MTVVHFKPEDQPHYQQLTLTDGETLLDGLLRHGYDIPFACKGGVCQSCLLQSEDRTSIPTPAQQGLTPTQVDTGLLLSCACLPPDHFRVQPIDLKGRTTQCRVLAKEALNAQIYRLRVSREQLDYRAGQFATLWRDNHIARSYSLTSLPGVEDFLEFHIKRVPNGAFSEWAWQQLNIGDTLQVQGPLGSCYYTGVPVDAPLLLCGIGTGLAPLYGIVRDALQQGHQGNIDLVLGANTIDGFYLGDELQALVEKHPTLTVHRVARTVDSNTTSLPLQTGDFYAYVAGLKPSTKGHHVYLCGAESFVKKMKRQVFLAGASMKDIHSDPFIAFQK